MVIDENKLTICMPVYNGENYISESIKSVLDQSYKNFDLIVVDNCSTDNTELIVKKFNDSRVQFVRNEKNLGLVGNHKRCIELCETEYLNIWHDDDLMMPENLKRKIDILESNKNVGIVFSNLKFIDENGNSQSFKWNEDCQNDFFIKGQELFRKYILRMHIGAYFFIGSAICRKEIMTAAGGFDLNDFPLICDSSLWLRSLFYCDAACIGDALVDYRSYTNDSASEFKSASYLKKHYDIVKKYLYLNKERLSDFSLLENQIDCNFIKEASKRGAKACGLNDVNSAKEYLNFMKSLSYKKYYKEIAELKIRILASFNDGLIKRPLKKIVETLRF